MSGKVIRPSRTTSIDTLDIHDLDSGGIVGNICAGASAAACVFWALQAAGSTLTANSGLGLALLVASGLFIAFLTLVG